MYTLTPYGTGEDLWMAWQFDRPDRGEGMVQVFRRSTCFYDTARLPLRGLDPEARYAVTDLDHSDAPSEISGRELTEAGLRVSLPEKPAAALFKYHVMAR
jgi:alpha-galactosidase